MTVLDELVVKIEADLVGLKRGLREAEGATAKSSSRISRLFGGADKTTKRLTRSIFSLRSALVGSVGAIALTKVIGDFATFERGLIGVGKTANISGDDLESLGRRIQDIGRRTPSTTKDLLAIAQSAGQLGVKGVDNITKFTETVAKLGGASDLAGEEAASTLARILTVTGTPIKNVDRLGSSIVELGNNFAATESEIAGVALRVAQSTAQFDTTAADVVGIGAALRAVGVEAEAGGSVTGRAFQAINDAVRRGGKELRAFEKIIGKSGDEIRQTFQKNSTQAFREFVSGLGRIQKSGGDVAAALGSIGLEGVRVVQVLGTLATRSDVLTEALEQSNEEFETNTALTIEAVKAAESFSAQMVIFKNVVDEAAVEIGRALAPEVEKVTDEFRELILQAKESGQLEDIARGLGDAFGFMGRNVDVVAGAIASLFALRIVSQIGLIVSAFGAWPVAVVGAGAALGGLVIKMAMSEEGLEDLNVQLERHNMLMERADRLAVKAAESEGAVAAAFEEQAKESRKAADQIVANLKAQLVFAEQRLDAFRDLAKTRDEIGKTPFEKGALESPLFLRAEGEVLRLRAALRELRGDLRAGNFDDPMAAAPRGIVPPPPSLDEGDDDDDEVVVVGGTDDEVNKLAEAVAALRRELDPTGAAIEDYRFKLDLLGMALEQGKIDGDEYRRLLALLNIEFAEGSSEAEELAESINRVATSTADATTNADRLLAAIDRAGQTFSSAFEDAVLDGKDLQSVVQALERDLLRIGLQEMVTGPLFRGVREGLSPLQGIIPEGGGIQGAVAGGIGGLVNRLPSQMPGVNLGQFNAISASAEENIAANPEIFGLLDEAVTSTAAGMEGLTGALGAAAGGGEAAAEALAGSLVTGTAEAAAGAAISGTAATAAAGGLGEVALAAAAAALALESVAASSASSSAGSAISLASLSTAGGGPTAAGGGLISGPGSGTSDSISARLSDGEFVVNATATRANRRLLEAINAGGPRMARFADGGMVGGRAGGQMSGPGGMGDVHIHIGSEVQARELGGSVGQVRAAALDAFEIGRMRNR